LNGRLTRHAVAGVLDELDLSLVAQKMVKGARPKSAKRYARGQAPSVAAICLRQL
jgi:hypothetical protein